jgi:hypothetical protein
MSHHNLKRQVSMGPKLDFKYVHHGRA